MANAYSGGDLEELTCNHPDLGPFSFDPFANSDIMLSMSGEMSTDDDSMISASGVMIDQMNKTRDSLTVTIAGSMGDNTLEALVALQSSPVLGVWTAQSINGSTYRITGKPVGQLQNDANASKIDVKIAGGKIQKF